MKQWQVQTNREIVAGRQCTLESGERALDEGGSLGGLWMDVYGGNG